MATIKSFTDLPQSKELMRILSLESADMHYLSDQYNPIETHLGFSNKLYKEYLRDKWDYIPCWSLAALLSVIPQAYLDSIKQYDKKYWRCCAYFASDWHHSDWCDNPIDACYEMIIKLHELKKL